MSHCLYYRCVVGKGIAISLAKGLLKQLYIESLWSLHSAEVVALNIIASVIGYTSKSICNRQYGKSSSVLAGSLEATGNSFFGHKRTNTIVYANNTIGIIGQC